jgi:hypothetical protein
MKRITIAKVAVAVADLYMMARIIKALCFSIQELISLLF